MDDGGRPARVVAGAPGIARGGSGMNATSLAIGLLTGAIGMGYFIYGKRQAKFVPLIAGMILCVYPYFVQGVVWLVLIGVALMAAPFLIDF